MVSIELDWIFFGSLKPLTTTFVVFEYLETEARMKNSKIAEVLMVENQHHSFLKFQHTIVRSFHICAWKC